MSSTQRYWESSRHEATTSVEDRRGQRRQSATEKANEEHGELARDSRELFDTGVAEISVELHQGRLSGVARVPSAAGDQHRQRPDTSKGRTCNFTSSRAFLPFMFRIDNLGQKQIVCFFVFLFFFHWICFTFIECLKFTVCDILLPWVCLLFCLFCVWL